MNDDCDCLGPKFRVRDLDHIGAEATSCLDCIADELETLSVGMVVHWEFERVTEV
jgi:hypothetical protein